MLYFLVDATRIILTHCTNGTSIMNTFTFKVKYSLSHHGRSGGQGRLAVSPLD